MIGQNASAIQSFVARVRPFGLNVAFWPTQPKTGVLFGPNAQYLLKYGGFAHIWIPPKVESAPTNGF